jgi:hypothetical protein
MDLQNVDLLREQPKDDHLQGNTLLKELPHLEVNDHLHLLEGQFHLLEGQFLLDDHLLKDHLHNLLVDLDPAQDLHLQCCCIDVHLHTDVQVSI